MSLRFKSNSRELARGLASHTSKAGPIPGCRRVLVLMRSLYKLLHGFKHVKPHQIDLGGILLEQFFLLVSPVPGQSMASI